MGPPFFAPARRSAMAVAAAPRPVLDASPLLAEAALCQVVCFFQLSRVIS